jgi:hypothetical protein
MDDCFGPEPTEICGTAKWRRDHFALDAEIVDKVAIPSV